jgi:hypothetical protein
MTFAKRWYPKAKEKQCKQCGKEDAIPLRADELGKNCAKPIDEAKAKLDKKKKQQSDEA